MSYLTMVFLQMMQVNTYEEKIHLLVVDSFSSLITPILGGKDSNGILYVSTDNFNRTILQIMYISWTKMF